MPFHVSKTCVLHLYDPFGQLLSRKNQGFCLDFIMSAMNSNLYSKMFHVKTTSATILMQKTKSQSCFISVNSNFKTLTLTRDVRATNG